MDWGLLDYHLHFTEEAWEDSVACPQPRSPQEVVEGEAAPW